MTFVIKALSTVDKKTIANLLIIVVEAERVITRLVPPLSLAAMSELF